MTSRTEPLICKHLVMSGTGGDVTYSYYEIPFEYNFEEENDFEYSFEKEA